MLCMLCVSYEWVRVEWGQSQFVMTSPPCTLTSMLLPWPLPLPLVIGERPAVVASGGAQWSERDLPTNGEVAVVMVGGGTRPCR